MRLYGQFPGGGFVGDENCRPGYIDPRGGIETCGIVEFMHSFEMLTKITGNPVWADRCEEIAFNTFPAALTPDQKGLHYITCANQVQLDRDNKSPGIQNGGTMFAYSPFERYRCCQHNVSHGWPYYAEELWLATPTTACALRFTLPAKSAPRSASGTTVQDHRRHGLSVQRHRDAQDIAAVKAIDIPALSSACPRLVRQRAGSRSTARTVTVNCRATFLSGPEARLEGR